MSVRQLLRSMDSVEMSEWMAFERAHGPLNGDYESNALAGIQEQLQQISYLLSQAHFTDKTHRRGPIPKPERYPRPHESFGRQINSNFVEFEADEDEFMPLTEDNLLDFRIDPEEAEGDE